MSRIYLNKCILTKELFRLGSVVQGAKYASASANWGNNDEVVSASFRNTHHASETHITLQKHTYVHSNTSQTNHILSVQLFLQALLTRASRDKIALLWLERVRATYEGSVWSSQCPGALLPPGPPQQEAQQVQDKHGGLGEGAEERLVVLLPLEYVLERRDTGSGFVLNGFETTPSLYSYCDV